MALPDPETLAGEYRTGASLSELGARYGVDPSTVKRWLIRSGVAMRGRGGLQGPEPPAADVLVAAYLEGLTVRQVTEKFRTSHPRVSAALREAGVDIRTLRRIPTATDELIQEYLAGAKTVELAARYGSYPGGIATVLKEAGVELRGPSARKPRKGPPTSELIAEYRGGLSTVALARKYGMTPHSVRMRLVRAGVVLDGHRSRG